MSVKNIAQVIATQGGELVPIPPAKIDLRDAHAMWRYKADQQHRHGVYASFCGYCRAKIIRDSKQAGAYRGLFGTIRESKTLYPRARARISPLYAFYGRAKLWDLATSRKETMILSESLRARIYPILPFVLLFTVIRNYKKLAFLARGRVLVR